MYRKSLTRNAYERKRAKCADMRMAKERKRMERAEAMVECGRIVTSGCLGEHDVRLMAWPDDGVQVAVVVDGMHKRARTLRGVLKVLAEMTQGNVA